VSPPVIAVVTIIKGLDKTVAPDFLVAGIDSLHDLEKPADHQVSVKTS
jgi:hypothetical protein